MRWQKKTKPVFAEIICFGTAVAKTQGAGNTTRKGDAMNGSNGKFTGKRSGRGKGNQSVKVVIINRGRGRRRWRPRPVQVEVEEDHSWIWGLVGLGILIVILIASCSH